MAGNLGPVHDAINQRSPQQILDDLRSDGEPYLFATEHEVVPGNQFTIAGHPFSVRRMVTRAEFVKRMAELGRRADQSDPDIAVYFEVWTSCSCR
jgi:hypothetical protein